MADLDIYTCARCGKNCGSDWPDAEAVAEYEQRFGKPLDDDAVPVCDDCYKFLCEAMGEQAAS